MTDEDHIRYMLDGGTRGRVEGLLETRDAWGFGGSLWVSKVHAAFKEGPPTDTSGRIFALQSVSRFYLQPFLLPETGARGSAIWFQKGPRDERVPLGNRSLCGWVSPERETEAATWISFLNTHIQERLTAAGSQEPPDGNARLRHSLAAIEALGLSVPKAATMDEFMTKLEEMADQDGPIDLRTKTKATKRR